MIKDKSRYQWNSYQCMDPLLGFHTATWWVSRPEALWEVRVAEWCCSTLCPSVIEFEGLLKLG